MILVILLLAFILRMIVFNQSYWLDETVSLLAVKNFSYQTLVTEFPKFDFHPPLFYLLLNFWASLFGYTEVAVRILPIIFGVGTVWVVYKIAKVLKLNAMIAAILMATAPLHVYYSQEVRMYPLVSFFVALSFLFYLNLLKREKPLYWVLFSLSILLFMALDYVAIFVLPVFWIIPKLANKKKEFYISLFLAFVPLFIVAIFWLPIFFVQLSSGKELTQNLPLWAKVVGTPSIKELVLVWVKFIIGRITFYNKFVYGFLVLGFSLAIGYHFLNGLKNTLKTIGLWLLVPLAIGFVFSLFIPAFSYFRFLYLLPAFVLLITAGIKSKKGLAAILTINIVCLGIYYTNSNYWREEWREAVGFVERNSKSDDLVIFEFKEPVAGWEWYASGKLLAVGMDIESINELILEKKGIWYFEYLADITDPERKLLENLRNFDFNTVNEFSFRGVGKVIYLRRTR